MPPCTLKMMRVRSHRLHAVQAHDAFDVPVDRKIVRRPDSEALGDEARRRIVLSRGAEAHPVHADCAPLGPGDGLEYFAHRGVRRREQKLIAIDEGHPPGLPSVMGNEILVGLHLARRPPRPVRQSNDIRVDIRLQDRLVWVVGLVLIQVESVDAHQPVELDPRLDSRQAGDWTGVWACSSSNRTGER